MTHNRTWAPPFSLPEPTCQPVGYAWLVQKYQLDVLPHWRWTFLADRKIHREIVRDDVEIHVLPLTRSRGETDLDHLLFALREDGVSVAICRALFGSVDLEALGHSIEAELRRKPTGAFARRAWFLFEELTGKRLAIPDLRQGNYVPLLDPTVHVTGPVRKHRRQRIDVNLLGILDFAPALRFTEELRDLSSVVLREKIEGLVSGYDEDVVRRAVSYLYTRETMASFEIERERPASNRAERYIAMLKEAPQVPGLDEEILTRLQNAAVDPRYAAKGWRQEQNYVGEFLDLAQWRVHYICPKPEDLEELMGAFLQMTDLLAGATHPADSEELDAVWAATAISFAFVLLHPFEDGNGRLHRWLLHWVLSRFGVTPKGFVIPVSAVMLAQLRQYDEALESFSEPLMKLTSYDLNAYGNMVVHGGTIDLYRHPDLTPMAEGLWRWLNAAVDRELPKQLDFLVALDRTRREIQDIVDMPDRHIILFIKLCRSNDGQLSRRKRERHYAELTEEEIQEMEQVVRHHFHS